MMPRLLFAGAGALLIAGCATPPPGGAHLTSAEPRACLEWFDHLDAAVRRAGTADAQEARIENHPHLRANRFAAALAQDPLVSDLEFGHDVLPRLRALDRAARATEISNLPAQALPELGLTRAQALLRSEQCAALLLAAQRPDRAAIQVPDDYSDTLRLLGAYALARHPFTAGVTQQLAEVSAAFAKPLGVPAGGRVQRYAGVGSTADAAAVDPLANSVTPQASALLDRHQPVFEIEITGDDDLPGALAWDPMRDAPIVQREQPTVYRHIDFTRYRGHTLTQLVYTVWFGARPANAPGDLLAGHLDGLIWRVTLGADGGALIHDTIHPCGCYHYFIPTPRARPIPAPDDEPEWAFVPQTVRQLQPDERIVLRIATRTHSLERVTIEAREQAQRGATPLRALAQERLRTLPILGAPRGATRSAYGPDGLAPGTERLERFLFWPMGIASAGQMRQWGRHATAFVGRRHFDDADLFEKRFALELDDPGAAPQGPAAPPMAAPADAAARPGGATSARIGL